MGKRGRPLGHKLSEESKKKISNSRKGKSWNNETKFKISEGVRRYYENNPENINRLHGKNSPSYKHGESGTKIWMLWASIKQRCYNKNNKNYKYYGGKGIRMYPAWKHSYTAFRDWVLENGWKEGLQIHRIDNNKGYYPFNCVFLTPSEHSKITNKNKERTKLIN